MAASTYPISPEIPDELLRLGVALGLVNEDTLNTDWFSQPEDYLAQILTKASQRDAAIELAEELLGTFSEQLDGIQPPDVESWLTLSTGGSGDVKTRLFAILEKIDDTETATCISLGAQVSLNTNDLDLSLTLKVPLVKVSETVSQAEMLLGSEQGKIDLACKAYFNKGIGDGTILGLDGISIVVELPTNGAKPNLSVILNNLILPGDETATDVPLSDLFSTLDEKALKILMALIRSQGSLPDELTHLLALLGMEDDSVIPSLPLANIVTQGRNAMTQWFRTVVEDSAAFHAWLNRLIQFLQIGVPAWSGTGTLADPFSHVLAAADWSAELIVVTDPDPAGGAIVVRPGIRIVRTPPVGAPLNGTCVAEMHFFAFTLATTPSIDSLPLLQLRVDLGDEHSSPLLDIVPAGGVAVKIQQFRFGFTLDDSKRPIILLEAHNAVIAGADYPIVDLTSADAIQDAAVGAVGDIINELLNNVLGIANSDEARSIAVIAGLLKPSTIAAADPWPGLTNITELFSDPMSAIGCYHSRVLNQDGAWGAIAQDLALLLYDNGVVAPVITGTGINTDPWSLILFDNTTTADSVRGEVILRVYTKDDAVGCKNLHLSIRTLPHVPSIDGKQLSIAHEVELIRMKVPAPGNCPSRPDIAWVEIQRLDVSLGQDLIITNDNITLSAKSMQGSLIWHRINGVTGDVDIVDPNVKFNDINIDLPNLNLDWTVGLPNLDGLPWPAFELMFGDWFEGSDYNFWFPKLGGFFGWLPSIGNLNLRFPQLPDLNLTFPSISFPKLSLQLLFENPFGALEAWFLSLFGGGDFNFPNIDFPDVSLPSLSWLSGLFSGGSFDGINLNAQLTGNGTYSDPWAIRIGDSSITPELLIWIDPDGPSLAGITDLVAHLLPSELTGPLDGSGNNIPPLDRLVALLERVAHLIPELQSRLGNSSNTAGIINSIITHLKDSDGLVNRSAQVVAGWEEKTIELTAHLLAPGEFNPAQHLPNGAPGPQQHIYISSDLPGVTNWPGQTDNKTIDLRAVDLTAESFDLSNVKGNGPWYVLLPNISNVQTGDAPLAEKFNIVVTRLRRAVNHIRNEVPGDVALIAHSTAGLAARQVAADNAVAVSDIVTLCTPHVGVDLTIFNGPEVAEGLRLLQNLKGMLDDAMQSSTELKPLTDLIKTVTQAVDEYLPDQDGVLDYKPFPLADFSGLSLDDLPAGRRGMVVVARLAPDDLDQTFAWLSRRVLEAALTFLPGTTTDGNHVMTHLGVGVRMPLNVGSSDPNAIRVDSNIRLDLHSVPFGDDVPDTPHPTPLVTIQTTLSRNGGWLAGGPSLSHPVGIPRDPRVRKIQFNLISDLSAAGTRTQLMLHEASVYGIQKHRWLVDPNAIPLNEPSGFLPETEVLLGAVAKNLGSFPSSGTLDGFSELLQATGLASLGDDNHLKFQTDALRNFMISPYSEGHRWLDKTGSLRSQVLSAIHQFMGLTSSIDDVITFPINEVFEGTLDFSNSINIGLRTGTEALVIEDAIALSGSLQINDTKQIQIKLKAQSAANASPVGDMALKVDIDTNASDQLQIHLTGDELGIIFPDNNVELYPVPDTDALLSWLRYHVPGEVLRIGMEWVRNQVPNTAHFNQLLQTIDLIREGDPRNRIRNLAGVIAGPKQWFSHKRVLGVPVSSAGELLQLDATRFIGLFDNIRDFLNITAPSGQLFLPFGASISVSAFETGVRLSLLRTTATAGGKIDTKTHVVIDPGLQTRIKVDAQLELAATSDFEYVRVWINLGQAGQTLPRAGVRIKPAGENEITLTLLPTPAGFDQLQNLAVGAAVQHILPLVMDAISDLGNGIGTAIEDIGDALDLRIANNFDANKLKLMAQDPATYLKNRLNTAALDLLSPLADLVTPYLDSGGVLVDTSTGQLTISPTANVTFLLQAPLGAADFSLQLQLDNAEFVSGINTNLQLTIDDTGIQGINFGIAVTREDLLPVGPVSLLPVINIATGSVVTGDDRIELGLSFSITPTNHQGIILKIPFSGDAELISRSAVGNDGSINDAIFDLVRRYAMPLALDLIVTQPDVVNWLNSETSWSIPTDVKTIVSFLKDVNLLQDSAGNGLPPFTLHNNLITAMRGDTDKALLTILLPVLAQAINNLASIASFEPSLGGIKFKFISNSPAGRTTVGVNFSIDNEFDLFSAGGVRLFLETKNAWIPEGFRNDAGVNLTLLSIDGDGSINFHPIIEIMGLGIGAADASGGKLIDMIASVDQIKINVAYHRDFTNAAAEVVAGGRVMLRSLSFPVGQSTNNDNPVASKMLSQSNESETIGDNEELAPAFSPALLIFGAPSFSIDFLGGEDRESGPWWLSIQRGFGPIYVEQVGLNVYNVNDRPDRIAALLDAKVSLQGLTIGLDDLSVTIPFNKPYDLTQWSIDLAGLAIAYQSSSITVAGGFRRLITDGVTEYAGMLQVDAGNIGVTAIGAYGVFPLGSGSDTYTSLFAFAALRMPIGGPPPFFLTGLGGGMGINRKLLLPSITKVPSYPLVTAMNDSSAFASEPMKSLRSISGVFPPKRGHYWFAGGVRFTSFALVESVAVLSVELGDGVDVSLLGLSQMKLPRPGMELVSIELALRAVFSTREMILGIQAQLTDNSWLISHDCRLTGGFAFFTWFKKGEFVLTIGGYHPRFPKPSHFPVVPRLGFNWTVGSTITIKGDSYFALTASCVMAGASLEASYRSGIAWATFTAGFNALISWDPFYYDVEFFIRISAGVRIRVCFFVCGTIKLSFSIGANIRIWGPQLRGKVTLDLDVITITVKFGATGSTNSQKPMPWPEFYQKYITQGDISEPSMGMMITYGMLTPSSGSQDKPGDGTKNDPFKVNAEFAFLTHTRTVSNKVKFNTNTDLTKSSIPELDLGPMLITSVSSRHEVKIVRLVGSGSVNIDNSRLSVEMHIENVPMGAWEFVARESRVPDAKVDIAITGLRVIADVELDDQGDVTVKLDEIENGNPLPLPFHQERNSRNNFFPIVVAALEYSTAQSTLADIVFSNFQNKLVGASQNVKREVMAERVSPPKIAPLAEGMVDRIKDAVKIDEIEIPPDVSNPDLLTGAPKLEAVLRGNTAIEGKLQTGKTTVSQLMNHTKHKVKRVVVPSLKTVNTRWMTRSVAQLKFVLPGVTTFEQTVVIPGNGSVTGYAGETFEARRSYFNSTIMAKSLKDQESAFDSGIQLIAGDMMVWSLSNARFDRQDQRPSIEIEGQQQTRILSFSRAGVVLKDQTGSTFSAVIPKGTARITVIAQGESDDNNDATGYSGWHKGSQVMQVLSGTYVAPGAVLNINGSSVLRRRKPVTTSIISAAKAINQANWSATRLPKDTNTVAIILEATGRTTKEQLESNVTLGITGAQRNKNLDGSLVKPQLVDADGRLFAVYAITPEDNSDEVYINVVVEDSWSLAGVIGAHTTTEQILEDITAFAVEDVLRSMISNETGRSTLKWINPQKEIPELEIPGSDI